jgi:hypothetical protein
MKFPELSRKGDPSHLGAVARVVSARDEQRRLAAEADAAQGSTAEPAADSRLRTAAADVAAREAWVEWVERGV